VGGGSTDSWGSYLLTVRRRWDAKKYQKVFAPRGREESEREREREREREL